MVKTLRITSIVAAAVAVAFIILLAVFALRGDAEMTEFLAGTGAIEKFRRLAKKAPAAVEKVSPLIAQARTFALKLDPPKPKVAKKKPPVKENTETVAKKPVIPTPKVKQINTKFKLVGTCKYERNPKKSLALLDLTAKGQKWYRQGDEVGHLTIHQIDDDSITLYKGGSFNSEISVHRAKQTNKPLLKSDAELFGFKTSSAVETIEYQDVILDPTSTNAAGNLSPAAKAQQEKTSRREALKQSRLGGRDRNRAAASIKAAPAATAARKRPRRQAPQPTSTPAQRKKAAEDNIAQIKSIMNREQSEGGDDGAQESWEKMLKLLEEERDDIDKEATAGRVEKTRSSQKTK